MKKVVFIIFSLLLLVVGCTRNIIQHNTKLEESIYSIVKDQSNNEIDLIALEESVWDKAFLFPPYTMQESMDKQLGVQFKDPSKIAIRDDIFLLVFLNEGKVIQYAEMERQKSDFTIEEQEYLTPSDATIKIERY